MHIKCYIYVMDIIIIFVSMQLQPKRFEIESIPVESSYYLKSYT